MRILWHSAHPGQPTGYGSQTALLLPRLERLGHQVAVSCTGGQDSHCAAWNGIPCFPKTPYEDFGQDVVYGHYQMWKADLAVTFMCTWPLNPGRPWDLMRVIHVTPVDCDPMSAYDYKVIMGTNGTPAAISRHGEAAMRARGLDPLYLPHGVDTQVMRPPDDRDELRAALGLDGKFTVGMNFMNNDRMANRKAVPEQMAAFAAFHVKYPDSVLMIHAAQHLPEGHRLPDLIRHLGIAGCTVLADPYLYLTGQTTAEELAAWYGALDVLLCVSKGEGFGLPLLEAQACGTPVITMGWSTGPELCGAGWRCQGQKSWNDTHQADWHTPLISSVVQRLGLAYKHAGSLRAQARHFALGYDIDQVVAGYWEPMLTGLDWQPVLSGD